MRSIFLETRPMNNGESFVQLALRAFDHTSIDLRERDSFELHLRRFVMQEQLNVLTPAPLHSPTIHWNPSWPRPTTASQMLHG